MDFLLDTVMEIIFEVFLEGAVEGAMSSKIPKFWRFVLLSLVIMVYSGILYVAISIAIEHESIVAWICAVFILLIAVAAFIKKYKEYKVRNNIEKGNEV